jgi:flagellar FliL protein
MAKSAKPAPVVAEAPAKPKSKKLLLIILAVLILGAAGAGGWYFTKGGKPNEEHKAAVAEPPTFLILDPFTVNLQREESDQFLQIGITLKVASMELADKIRQSLPEVRSKLLFLLSSKRASELIPIEGKKKLAEEITYEINNIIGIHTAAPKAAAHENVAKPGAEAASGAAPAAEPAPASAAQGEAAKAPAKEAHGGESGAGVQDVLFTAFIIQ